MTYDEFLKQWEDTACRAISASTSGSTGKPKQIELSKKLLTESAMRTIRFFNLNEHSHLHSCISPNYIGGKMMAVRASCIGADFTWEEPSNAPSLTDRKADLTSVVPSQMWHILTLPKALEDRFLIGGSAIPATLRKAISESHIECWESYGMTETASHIALRRVENEEGPFYPLPGISIYLGDEGNLCISLGEDYPPVITNDIAEIYSDGGFRILGRRDNVIISGGLKIIPEDVERRISPVLAQFGYDTFMISSTPDNKWGEKIILVIETEEELSDHIKEEITRLLGTLLRRYEIPKEIISTGKIPTTANGKIKRKG